MTDKKNIETLFQELTEMNLPKGYDDRFHAKMEREENPLRSWLERFSLTTMPTNLGWAVSLGSLLLVTLSVLRVLKKDDPTELAVNDEIDMLDDLDVLMAWDEKEDNV